MRGIESLFYVTESKSLFKHFEYRIRKIHLYILDYLLETQKINESPYLNQNPQQPVLILKRSGLRSSKKGGGQLFQ